MSAYQLPPFVWPSAVMGVCAIAIWRGGPDERLAAGGLLAGWALTMVAYQAHGQVQTGVMIIDLALLGFLVWLAMRSPRHWPLFASGFQLLAVLTHLGREVDSGISTWAYLTAEIIWGYLLAFAIGYGAWTAGRTGRKTE